MLLRFVALYSLFDMMNVIFAAALRGAGDTFYPLALTVVLAWGAMLVPAYLVCVVGGARRVRGLDDGQRLRRSPRHADAAPVPPRALEESCA